MNFELLHFGIGFIVGAAVVGSSVMRTLYVDRGNVQGAFISSVINSISYFYSVYAIAKENHVGFLGTAVGSTLLMIYMAWKKKQQKEHAKQLASGDINGRKKDI